LEAGDVSRVVEPFVEAFALDAIGVRGLGPGTPELGGSMLLP
jgi:hypothetical protein